MAFFWIIGSTRKVLKEVLKIHRHATLSLEMLLKLVAVFGPVIHSAISTPRAVGVDLHAEKRCYITKFGFWFLCQYR